LYHKNCISHFFTEVNYHECHSPAASASCPVACRSAV
jgi:hypothetical protein